MFVFGNVIKPQGLEPLQFPTKFRSPSKEAAIIKLDEMDNAEGCPLIKLDECQVHFRLTDDGQLELQSFGEETESEIWNFCYPVLDGVLTDKAPEDWSVTEREAVHQAVRRGAGPGVACGRAGAGNGTRARHQSEAGRSNGPGGRDRSPRR